MARTIIGLGPEEGTIFGLRALRQVDSPENIVLQHLHHKPAERMALANWRVAAELSTVNKNTD